MVYFIAICTMLMGAAYLIGIVGYPAPMVLPWSVVLIVLSIMLLIFYGFDLNRQNQVKRYTLLTFALMQIKPTIFYFQNHGIGTLFVQRHALAVHFVYATPHIALFCLCLIELLLGFKKKGYNRTE